MQSFVESRAFITSDRAEVVDTVFGKAFNAVVLLKLIDFSHMNVVHKVVMYSYGVHFFLC